MTNLVPNEFEPVLRETILALVRHRGATEALRQLAGHPAIGSLDRLKAILRELWPALVEALPDPAPEVPATGMIQRTFDVVVKLETVNGSIGGGALGSLIMAPGANASGRLVVVADFNAWKSGGPATISGHLTRLSPPLVKDPTRLRFAGVPGRLIVGAADPGLLVEFVADGIAISAHAVTADGWTTAKLAAGLSVPSASPWSIFGESAQLSGTATLVGSDLVSNDWNPAPAEVPSTGTAPVHATTFLRNNAKISSHVLMSPKLTDDDRAELIAFNRAAGYGAFYLYLANEGDYGRRQVEYQREDRERWREWLAKIIASGARPIVWMCADDSGGLSKRSDADWETLVHGFHRDCGDLVAEWVTGLECDERWSAKRTQGLTAMLKRVTGKPVGVHTTGLSAIGHAAGADKFYLQCGFGNTAAQVAAMVKAARSKFGGGSVICAEYHKSGETDAAMALGDAAIAAGAAGVGNGCTAKGLALLAGASAGPATETPATGLLRSVTASKKKYYIDWDCDPAVDAWPAKVEGRKSLNGFIVLNGIKCEQFQPGYRSQHLKNAYGADEHGVRGIKTGDTVTIALAAKHSKARTNEISFVWPWEPT